MVIFASYVESCLCLKVRRVYEASKDYDIADRYVDAYIKEIAAKRLFPFSGIPLQYRGLFTGFYSVNYKKYKAFYRVREGYIEVIRIIMAKRDYSI